MEDNKNVVLTMADLKSMGCHPITIKKCEVKFSEETKKEIIKLYRKQIKNRRKWG